MVLFLTFFLSDREDWLKNTRESCFALVVCLITIIFKTSQKLLCGENIVAFGNQFIQTYLNSMKKCGSAYPRKNKFEDCKDYNNNESYDSSLIDLRT